jgi:hypothetical protein
LVGLASTYRLVAAEISAQLISEASTAVDNGHPISSIQAHGIIAVRKVVILVEATNAKGKVVVKEIPYIELEFDVGTPDLGLNSMHVLRIGITDWVIGTWTREHHGILRIEPKEFRKIPNWALISYGTGYPAPRAYLKEAYARTKVEQPLGLILGRLDKSLMSKKPPIYRTPNEIP